MQKIFLIFSLLMNMALGSYILFMQSLSWKVEERLGVLTEDVAVGEFGGSERLFVLPKGLAVADASSSNQIDQFEPFRFSIIVTSDRGLVDYGRRPAKHFGNLYSADLRNQP